MSSRTEQMVGEPQTVDEARHAVERSRERISHTLDELEGRIVEKKHSLQDRMDVMRPVREQVRTRPFTAVAVALGTGVLLGSLGGGEEKRRGRHHGVSLRDELSEDERRELREWRRERRERLRSWQERDHEDGESRFENLRHQLMGMAAAAMKNAISSRVRDYATHIGDGRRSAEQSH